MTNDIRSRARESIAVKDLYIILPFTKRNHKEDFKLFNKLAGITEVEHILWGCLEHACIVMGCKLAGNGPLRELVASFQVRDKVIMGNIRTNEMVRCGPIPHMENYTTGTLAGYDVKDLNDFDRYIFHAFNAAQGIIVSPETSLTLRFARIEYKTDADRAFLLMINFGSRQLDSAAGHT